jgi:hypothetical protein
MLHPCVPGVMLSSSMASGPSWSHSSATLSSSLKNDMASSHRVTEELVTLPFQTGRQCYQSTTWSPVLKKKNVIKALLSRSHTFRNAQSRCVSKCCSSTITVLVTHGHSVAITVIDSAITSPLL